MMKVPGTVLIVNDVPVQLHLMTSIVQQAGYGGWEATDGLEAFEAARQLEPTLIMEEIHLLLTDG